MNMDRYDEEIFNFLTERKNFEAMLKVNSKFRIIREQLLHQFWNQVAVILNKKLIGNTNNWKVLNPNNKENPKAKLMIYKDAWKQKENLPFVGVAWEGLFSNSYSGVYNNIESKLIDSEKLKNALDDLRIRLDFQRDTNWWPMWRRGPYNFSIDNDLVNILPDRLNTSAEEYSDILLKILAEVEPIIDHVLWN